MISMMKELLHLAHILISRGVLMLVLGAMAMLWPASVLIPAIASVGFVATLFGLYESSIALSIRHQTTRWPLVLVDGAATTAFGLLTLGSFRLSLDVGLVLTDAWLLLYAGLAVYAAVLVWPRRAAPWALLTWASLDLGIAIYALMSPTVSVVSVLFLGPLFAAAFGAWQLAVGLWSRATIRKAFASASPPSIVSADHLFV